MSVRAGYLPDAYIAGIELRRHLRKQRSLCEALHSLDGPFDKLTDGYPDILHHVRWGSDSMLTYSLGVVIFTAVLFIQTPLTNRVTIGAS